MKLLQKLKVHFVIYWFLMICKFNTVIASSFLLAKQRFNVVNDSNLEKIKTQS